MQTFTRPTHGPRMYDVGHSGNAPLTATSTGQSIQVDEGQPRITISPQQTGREASVSPMSPAPSAEAQDVKSPSPQNRTGAIPWEDGYPSRYPTW